MNSPEIRTLEEGRSRIEELEEECDNLAHVVDELVTAIEAITQLVPPEDIEDGVLDAVHTLRELIDGRLGR